MTFVIPVICIPGSSSGHARLRFCAIIMTRRRQRPARAPRSNPITAPTTPTAEPDAEPAPLPTPTEPTAADTADAPLSLVGTGRWSRFLNAALEHVVLVDLLARNAAIADHLWPQECAHAG